MTLWPIEEGRGIQVPSSGRSVIIPQTGSRPAYGKQPFFDAFDPQDIDLFQYDWSSEALPGDTILSALITTNPATLTVSPPIIFGLVVQVFIGPGVAIAETYDVTCHAWFSSGRVLNWGCEMTVRTL